MRSGSSSSISSSRCHSSGYCCVVPVNTSINAFHIKRSAMRSTIDLLFFDGHVPTVPLCQCNKAIQAAATLKQALCLAPLVKNHWSHVTRHLWGQHPANAADLQTTGQCEQELKDHQERNVACHRSRDNDRTCSWHFSKNKQSAPTIKSAAGTPPPSASPQRKTLAAIGHWRFTSHVTRHTSQVIHDTSH